jgi:hypothetical protein
VLRCVRSVCVVSGLNLTGVRDQLDHWNQAARSNAVTHGCNPMTEKPGGAHPVILIGAC